MLIFMAVKFKDYYEILGVPRTASQDEIKAAYRKLARKHHPDVNKSPGAEEKFKELNEAHEVLRDPEKRQKYDQLGSNWRNGQDYSPRGWEGHSAAGGGSDFSDFFESLFGGRFGGFSSFEDEIGPRRRQSRQTRDMAGSDQTVRIRIPLEDTFHGVERTISLREIADDGRETTRSIRVKIPQGVTHGQRIRLSGQGGEGRGRGPRGDLYLEVELEPHPLYRVGGRDLYMDLKIAPWEAALGASIVIPTLAGNVSLNIP